MSLQDQKAGGGSGETHPKLVQILEDGNVIQSEPLLPDQYIVICGENRYIDGFQNYPKSGTVVVTIKRMPEADR